MPEPKIGSKEYFDQMPVKQLREEAFITWTRYKKIEQQLFELRCSLRAFKSLLDDC